MVHLLVRNHVDEDKIKEKIILLDENKRAREACTRGRSYLIEK